MNASDSVTVEGLAAAAKRYERALKEAARARAQLARLAVAFVKGRENIAPNLDALLERMEKNVKAKRGAE